MCNLGQQSITDIISNEEQAVSTQYLCLEKPHCLTKLDACNLKKATGFLCNYCCRKVHVLDYTYSYKLRICYKNSIFHTPWL